MKFANNISKFFIENASYFIKDKAGNKLVINIDYLENAYKLRVAKERGELTEIRNEAKQIAEDLLKRKSRVNIVNR